MKIYQHPALVPSSGAFQVPEPSEALRSCPKLRSVISQIDRIRSVNEKVLVFTRNLHMQSILKRAFQAAFGLNVDILNGSVSPERETRSAGNTRSALIDRFQNAAGFNVLILSPDVAGVGLTLTAANHVIHYGRWWNPAREAQATDRVYRIGQTRPVHVYFPIARDPVGEFVSFDEKLDLLIRKRRALADDFLAPMPSEDDYQRELLSTLLGDKAETIKASHGTESSVDLLALTWDQFEACVATIYEQEGALALLTPRTNDGGVDVLALFDDHLKVIQCKHSSNGAPIDSQALGETINAVDMLRFEFKDILQDLPIAAVLATTGEVMPNTLNTATIKSVEVLDREALKARLLRCGATHHHWRAMEARRLGSRMALRAALTEMMRKRSR